MASRCCLPFDQLPIFFSLFVLQSTYSNCLPFFLSLFLSSLFSAAVCHFPSQSPLPADVFYLFFWSVNHNILFRFCAKHVAFSLIAQQMTFDYSLSFFLSIYPSSTHSPTQSLSLYLSLSVTHSFPGFLFLLSLSPSFSSLSFFPPPPSLTLSFFSLFKLSFFFIVLFFLFFLSFSFFFLYFHAIFFFLIFIPFFSSLFFPFSRCFSFFLLFLLTFDFISISFLYFSLIA